MKKIAQHITIFYVFCMCFATQAQAFFTEDFNSYPIGTLNTVYDNTTPGHGGWLVSRGPNSSATGMITAEAGKGNVLTITTSKTTSTDSYGFKQEDGFLTTLWNNRTPGNNIFKFEYEFYGVGTFGVSGHILNSSNLSASIIGLAFQSVPGPNLYRIGGGI